MFNEYLKQISDKYRTGESQEHTYRTGFENLLNQFVIEVINRNDLKIINEPKRQKFGAPDFKIIDKANNIIGYIECKDIGEDIESLIDSPQMKKYLEITNNLVLTNYIDFILFKNGSVVKNTSIASKLDLKQAKPKAKNEKEIIDIFKSFFLSSTEQIKSTKKLSVELAKRTRILRDLILEELSESMLNPEYKDHDPSGHKMKNPFNKFYLIFEKALVKGLTLEDFADMYAEIIGFGLLFFRLSKDILLTKENILSNIPHYIPLLRDFFPNTKFDEWNPTIVWVLDEIFLLLNNIDAKIIKESLSYKTLSILNKREANLNDPFLYFYEEFLEVYDKNTKVRRGVFYTPESVVSFIIRSLDVILKEKLGIKKGFLDSSIKILDFATGTGTFILALIELIKNELKRNNNYGLFNTEVNEFILKNIYGFELLVVPYIICHLRIHEYLESFGFHYSGDKKERAEIYLTNTLDNTKYELTGFYDEIEEESELANKVKNEEEILVIMGNPPYSVSSSNKTGFVAEELMKTYKKAVKEERNIQPLSDDYIKFIRFAHWKMEKVKKGVIGIITNNSFIDGIIHRGMREELTKTFDEIYILNLHGNSNIGETCPDGSKDENVFDIKQGVSISFFVKTGKKKNENIGIYYFSSQGLREKKYEFLYENNINKIKWDKLKSELPNFWFKKKDLRLEDEYNNNFSISNIFIEYNCGVKTHNDNELVYLNKKNLGTEKKYFYRPFDNRIINYDLKKVVRHRYNLMKYFLTNENLGLCFVRQLVMSSWQHVLITNFISDICSVSINQKKVLTLHHFTCILNLTQSTKNELQILLMNLKFFKTKKPFR